MMTLLPDASCVVTRAQVTAALAAAVAEAGAIAGDDPAIGLVARLAAGEPAGDGSFTRSAVLAAWNAAADGAKQLYNPDEEETSDSIRSDSCGDLIVNLAAGFLGHPDARADDVIAAAWQDLEPVSFDGFEVWTEHATGLGDYCPWSGHQATPANREALVTGLADGDELCPQGCPASSLTDPEPGTAAHDAAIVAEVKGWLG
jgi:hypothetical protein